MKHDKNILFFSILITSLTLLCGASSAQAQEGYDPMETMLDNPRLALGYGASHIGGVSFTYVRHGHINPDDRDEEDRLRNPMGVLLEGAVMPLMTMFGSQGGLEGGIGLGVPLLRSFFGGVSAHLGVVLAPIPLEMLRFSVAAGVGIGGHRHAYIKPRVALKLGPVADLELSYKWVPAVTSRVWSQDHELGDVGISEKRARGTLWINFGQSDWDFESSTGVHVFIERTEIASDDLDALEQKSIPPGTYWGGGVGYSF